MSIVSICDDIDELVTRYAYGSSLSQKERSRVEEHLKGCASCGDLVFFVQKTMALARKEPIRSAPSTEPCLATDTFIALDEGTLDVETARKAKLHLLSCPSCREVFLKLRTLSEQKVEERVLEYLDAPKVTDAGVRIGLRVNDAVATLEGNLRISGTGRILEFGPKLHKCLNRDGVVIGDTVTDQTGLASLIGVVITASGDNTASLFIESNPPRGAWSADLVTAGGERLFFTASIDASLIALGPEIPLGLYVISVRNGEHQLATFSVELRSDSIAKSPSVAQKDKMYESRMAQLYREIVLKEKASKGPNEPLLPSIPEAAKRKADRGKSINKRKR